MISNDDFYARAAWYVVAWSSELNRTKPTSVMVLGEQIIIWQADDCLVAMEDRCPHRLAPLSLGRCEGASIRCLYHGLIFDKDGKCIRAPGQDKIPPTLAVKPYPVTEKHGWVWVWMGDPDEADIALVPDLIGVDTADFHVAKGTLDYDADAYLINRNLLDFSHVPFVHSATFQAPEEAADVLPHWTRMERGLRYTSWTRSVLGSAVSPSAVPIDDMLGYDYVMPGIMSLLSGHFPLGTADDVAGGRPDFANAVGAVIASGQAVTPVDDRKARYFFWTGPRKDCGSQQLAEMLDRAQHAAFAEDKIMIEAQQKIIDRSGGQRPIPTAHDRAITLFEQMVKKLNAADANGANTDRGKTNANMEQEQ